MTAPFRNIAVVGAYGEPSVPRIARDVEVRGRLEETGESIEFRADLTDAEMARVEAAVAAQTFIDWFPFGQVLIARVSLG